MSAHREAHKRLRSQTFSIVSDDCWGGEVYKLTGAPFATPFIGLYIIAPSYLKILRDLPTALTSELVQTKASRYPEVEQVRKDVRPFPVGVLTDVDAELEFLHYVSWDEAYEKWMRRRGRVDLNDPLVKMTCPNDDVAAEFCRLPFRTKLLVAESPFPSVNTAVAPFHPDVVVRFHAGSARFDHIDWLNGGSGQVVSPLHRLTRQLKYGGWP